MHIYILRDEFVYAFYACIRLHAYRKPGKFCHCGACTMHRHFIYTHLHACSRHELLGAGQLSILPLARRE